MLGIELEGVKTIQGRLEQMHQNIEGVGVARLPIEFEEWQRQDLKRDHPNMEQQGWSVSTIIWPTSRKKMIARKRAKFETRRHFRGLRPILRSEMFEALRERMRAMMKTYLHWK